MLRVGLDYRPALLLRSGIGRYTSNLVRHLPEVDDEIQLSLFSVFWKEHEERIAQAHLPETERVKLAAARFPGRVLDFLGRVMPLSVETFSDHFDLFHFTDYVQPPVRTKCSVFTLHDTSFLGDRGYHSPENSQQLTSVTQSLIDQASVVITVSEATKRDALESYDLDESRVVVTPLGVDEIFLQPYERSVQDCPFILSVGTLEPRKNHLRLLRAFESRLEKGLRARMILVGRKGWMCDDVLEALERPLLRKWVCWIGEIQDAALLALMRNATAMAYPSLLEGFGLPVLEAMALGLPVLTSARGGLEEVAGDATHLVDPECEDSIAAGLEKLCEDTAYREELCRRGKIQAKKFSWQDCASRTLDAYRLALALEPKGEK
ncbi:MAG: glycosyltransferase family 1 protein [Planctomycetota bacterium]